MRTLDAVLLALGIGNRRYGLRLAELALAASVPVLVFIGIVCAMGPGR